MSASQTKTRWLLGRIAVVVVIAAGVALWVVMVLDLCRGRHSADFLDLLAVCVLPMALFRFVPKTIQNWKANRPA
jgi:hypothetical protein